MESFRDYDAETFRAVHHRDAITIFASGAVRTGVDAIMAALAPHFANREAIWAWSEVYRVVDGCKSAFILYDATYDIPSIGYHQRTLTGVTYTHQGEQVAGDRGPGDLSGSARPIGAFKASPRRRAHGSHAAPPSAAQY